MLLSDSYHLTSGPHQAQVQSILVCWVHLIQHKSITFQNCSLGSLKLLRGSSEAAQKVQGTATVCAMLILWVGNRPPSSSGVW